MDPTNNPTPTPTPMPGPIPPAPSETPVPPIPPVPSETPVSPIPSASPEAMISPEMPVPPVAAPEPVTPEPMPQAAVSEPVATEPMSPPVVSESMMADEPPKASEPAESELNSPMVAVGPVPGSIGSAVSGPAGDGTVSEMPTGENPFENVAPEKTQNVAFNDPAIGAGVAMGEAAKPAKKPQNKKTLIILVAIAAVVVVALIVILIMQFTGGNGGSSGTNANNSNNANNSGNSGSNSGSGGSQAASSGTLSCTRNMTKKELVTVNDAVSGSVNISAKFEDDELGQIALVKSVVYDDEDGASNEPVEAEVHEATAEDLTSDSAEMYYLPINNSGKILTDLESVQENYEELDFKCELL